jgi:hypothetical protein
MVKAKDGKENPGWFAKGRDRRRHQLTQEERRRGYQRTKDKYLTLGDEAALWLLWVYKRHLQATEKRKKKCRKARR